MIQLSDRSERLLAYDEPTEPPAPPQSPPGWAWFLAGFFGAVGLIVAWAIHPVLALAGLVAAYFYGRRKLRAQGGGG